MSEKQLATSDTTTGILEAPPAVSEWNRFRRVFFQRRLVMFGLGILFIVVFCAAFAQWVAPHDPYRGKMADSLMQPCREYPMGTDIQGRDTLSRLIYGTRTVLMVGFITVTVAGVIGVTLGLAAGFFGGILNMVIMRAMDALMGFPFLLLALLLSAVLGGGIQNVIIALSIALIPGYARVTHGLTLSI